MSVEGSLKAAAAPARGSELEFCVLGPLEVRRDGRPIALGPRKQRALLALLLLEANRVIARDRLVEELWAGAPPAGALKTLRSYVSRLRALLGGDLLVSRAPGYVLQLRSEQRVSERFARLCREGREALADGAPLLAAGRLREALSLWRGSPLADLADEPFAQAESARLEELRVTAVEDRIEADIELGRHAEAVGELETLLQEHPLRERLWGQLMVALYRCERQADALGAYRRMRDLLGEALGLEPGERLQQLQRMILRHELPVARAAKPVDNLPAQLTSFVGREPDLAELEPLLAEARLLTLTGAGGCGKTRLAIELAKGAVPRFRDGVLLVELAGLRNPELVPHTVAAALDVRERSGEPLSAVLAERLRPQQLLLVLDNCEHLAAACKELARTLLRACPSLHLLATSRTPLGLAGEILYRVAPLAVPTQTTEDPGGFASVQLFLDRAGALRPAAEGEREALALIAAICRALDGLPLALELAAARTRVLTLGEIAARLDDRFRLLRSDDPSPEPRHQTLAAAIDWSHELLAEGERTLLHRLSVFAGGFDLAAATAVCLEDDEEQTVDSISRLIDASLLFAEPRDGRMRYRLLETVRHYGAERLAELGETDDARGRHAAHFLALAEQARLAIYTAEEGRLLRRLEEENDNLRAALDWLLAHPESDRGPGLARGLGNFWLAHGHLNEGRSWLEQALALPRRQPATVRADLLGWLGAIHVRQNQFALARERLEEAVRLARSSGARRSEAFALHFLAYAWHAQNEFERARELLTRAVLILEAIGDNAGAAKSHGLLADIATREGRLEEAERGYERVFALVRQAGSPPLHVVSHLGSVADLAFLKGDLDEAERLAEECLKWARDIDEAWHIGLMHNTRARIARERGELDRAEELATEGLARLWALDEMGAVAGSLEILAGVELDKHNPRQAADLTGAAAKIRERHNAPLAPADRPRSERDHTTLRRELGDAAFDDARRQSERTDPEQTIAGALAGLLAEGLEMPGRAAMR